MEQVVNFIKTNKIKIIVIIVAIILLIFGIKSTTKNNKKEYSVTEITKYNYFQLNENGKYGVIDVKGNTIVEPIYDSVKIPNPEKAVFICVKDNNNIVLNENNEEIFQQYEEVSEISINGVVSNQPYEKEVLKYKINGKYGLIKYDGKVVTKPIYEEIKGLSNKESELLVKKDEKYGVINQKGAELIANEYDDIVADGFYTGESKYGLSGYIVSNKTKDGYRYGYIDYKQNKVLDVEYNNISRILETNEKSNVYLIVSKNGKYGVLKNNKELINCEYQGIEYESNNKLFELQRNSKYGIADMNGKIVIPIEYSEIEVKGTYLQAMKNEEYKYFNTSGEQVNSSEYTAMIKTDNNKYYITINTDGFYGIVDGSKKQLVENKYNYLEYLFDEYFIASNQEGNLGIINTKDDTVVDFKYEVLQKIDNTCIVEAKILGENKTELYSKKIEKIFSNINTYIHKTDEYVQASSRRTNKVF